MVGGTDRLEVRRLEVRRLEVRHPAGGPRWTGWGRHRIRHHHRSGDAISDRIPVAPNHVADRSFSVDDPVAAFHRADDALPFAVRDYASGSTSGSVTADAAETEAPPEEQPLNPLEATPTVSAGTSTGPAVLQPPVPTMPGGEAGEVRGLPAKDVAPPVHRPEQLTPGPAGRPSEAATASQSLPGDGGGEWRYVPGDKLHNPHGDYNDRATPNSPRQNVPIGRQPSVKPDIEE